MKKIIAFMLTSFISTLLYSEPPLCISLGSFCAPAMQLRDLNIRKDAYPFDWIKVSFDSLYACLNDDFNKFSHNLHSRKNEEIIDYYGLIFLHDWPTKQSGNFDVLNNDHGVGNDYLISNWDDYTPLVREKYTRRIKRFKEKCSESNKIYFIRYHDITKQQAIMLRDLIQKKYKNLDFELIIISDDKTKWNLDKIKNFYMYLHDWNKLNLWTNIFDQVEFEFKQ